MILFCFSPPLFLALIIFLLHLPQYPLSLWRGQDIDAPYVAKHDVDSCSLNSDPLHNDEDYPMGTESCTNLWL